MSNIRKALTSDINTIFALGKNVAEFSVNNETVSFWPESTLQRAVTSNDTLIFVAEENKVIVGFIIATYNQGLQKSTIENILVAPEHRGTGLGHDLLEKLLQALAEKDCKYVATLIPLDAIGALTLYEQSGFSKGETFLWLDKTLSVDFKRTDIQNP